MELDACHACDQVCEYQIKFDSIYAPAFRRAHDEPPQRKLFAIVASDVKPPGIGPATGSAIIHFMHPGMMPMLDVFSAEVLFEARLISTR
jgi:hypothetical protein